MRVRERHVIFAVFIFQIATLAYLAWEVFT